MKLYPYLLCSLCAVSASSYHLAWRRQDTTTSIVPSTSVIATTSSLAPSASLPPTESSSNGSATAASQAAKTTASPSTFSLVPGSAPSVTTSAQTSNQTTTGDPIPLPIPPKLTPAIGLAGAVLMITGLAYGVVGIRNKWMYTFFGVAYLVSIAVLVLILYCMNPPVTDKVQGAYFVAIVVTGCLCGGVALVFRDLADGFGCLLGGFTVSMWFLTLAPGGVIPSSVGRAVFIGALTIAVGATGLSHRTRRYGLIGSIPFSGATATILGVDCFSRAGMKEFWIYLWNLNSNEFPLNTDTYPLTRGMKVEIAGIILLSLLGILSQIKLSKVLRERKEKLFDRTRRNEGTGSRALPKAGERVVSMLQIDHGRYQAIQGDKSVSTLTVVPSSETLDHKSLTVKERRITGAADLEMANIRSIRHPPPITESDSELELSPYLGPQNPRRSGVIRSAKSRTSFAPSERGIVDSVHKQDSHDDLAKAPLSPPAPEVVPLPFKIPSVEVSGTKSQSSLTAIEEDFLAHRGSTQRTSGTSWKRASNRASGGGPANSSEDLILPDDIDNSSSVAATFDELDEDQMSLSSLAAPHSPIEEKSSAHTPSQRASIADLATDGHVLPSLRIPSPEHDGGVHLEPKLSTVRDEKRDSVVPTAVSLPRSEASEAPQSPRLPPLEKQSSASGLAVEGKRVSSETSNKNASKRTSTQSNALQSIQSANDADKSGKSADAPQQPPAHLLTREVLSEQLADGVSKITLQYRTNEWAKHLENAEEPDEDELTQPPSPGVQVDTMFRDAAQHTPLSPVVDPARITAPKPVAKRSSTDPVAHQRKKSRSEALAKLTSGAPHNVLTVRRQSSANRISGLSQSRPGSTTMAWPGPSQRISRQVSAPILAQPPQEAPQGPRATEARNSTQKRSSSAKKPIPENTLLVQRESKLQSMPKSQSFAVSAPSLAVTPATPAASVLGKVKPVDKNRLPDPSQSESQARRTSTNQQGVYTPQPVISHDLQNFNSHQPHRRNSAMLVANQQRRENLLTDWRESLREDQNPQRSHAQQKPNTDEAQRLRLLQEQRQNQLAREQEKLAKAKKEERISSKMMNGGGNMLDAHRKAMLRMQNSVKQ